MLKIIFVGTPEFSVPCLQALCRDPDFEVAAVITHPDMPVGRQQVWQEPPIKIWAKKLGIKNVWQPQKIIQSLDQIRQVQPEIIVVVSYSQIIPPEILRLPKFCCVNVHPSLLPKYRGATPIQTAILNNESKTGVTIMLMDETFDTGPILSQIEVKLKPTETAGSLFEKLAPLSAKLLTSTLKKYLSGQLLPQPQANQLASYAPLLRKGDGLINWEKSACELERFIRAMGEWPGAWTWVKGKQLKVLSAEHFPLPINSYKPGKTFLYNNQLAAQCGADALIITELQLEGKSAQTAKSWLNGHQDFIGTVLG